MDPVLSIPAGTAENLRPAEVSQIVPRFAAGHGTDVEGRAITFKTTQFECAAGGVSLCKPAQGR
ncbi:hypothetical protein METH_02945 [Leisingera methylohalidivorans DSM 14336]|uniref:Uncharacterized protein n=1 Tax=Leisingera methylohalidivorans DSM 14336 TaxID=999552 RepID=V9W113_9RHOB|nr:hypothetical protein METH_02945 [Leisingera methylohalidivorans DSM 14336]